MLEKAIAGWLTNATEKAYQPAFVSLLMHRGDTVLYNSLHRPLEQGKDVAARNAAGRIQAYQLKGGNIDITAWRRIHGEIDDLVSMPVRHPSVDPAETYEAYLVTNGRVVDEVLVTINEYNAANAARGKGWAPLQIIQGDALLGLFQAMGSSLLPVPPQDARMLFNTYCSDGTDLITLPDVEGVICALCLAEGPRSKAAMHGAVARSVLVGSFLMKPFEEAKNYFAVIQGWTLLAMGVSRFAFEHEGAEDRIVRDVLSLIFDKIATSTDALRLEAMGRSDLLEGNWLGDGGDLYRARATVVVGTVCAGEVVRVAGGGSQPDAALRDFILKYRGALWLWGEAGIPHCVCIVKCLELLGEKDVASALLTQVLQSVVQANRVGGTADVAPLPSPYLSAETVLLDLYEVDPSKDKIDGSAFVGQSWMLHPLVLMCARREMRGPLESLWKDISKIQCMTFEPADAKAFCQLRSENGLNRNGTLNAQQSWAKLQELARSAPSSEKMWPLWGPHLLWLLLLVPQRWREPYASLVDGMVPATGRAAV